MPKVYIIGIILVLLVAAFFFFQSTSISEESEQIDDTPVTQEPGDEEGKTKETVKHVIVYSDTGYSPKEITIQVDQTVTFTNESSRGNRPASAVHPIHTAYPGSSIQKCGTGEVIFDACKVLNPGEEWSFTFSEAGEWGYHNHRRSADFGKVIVQ